MSDIMVRIQYPGRKIREETKAADRGQGYVEHLRLLF